jgi:hypothetical protein
MVTITAEVRPCNFLLSRQIWWCLKNICMLRLWSPESLPRSLRVILAPFKRGKTKSTRHGKAQKLSRLTINDCLREMLASWTSNFTWIVAVVIRR